MLSSIDAAACYSPPELEVQLAMLLRRAMEARPGQSAHLIAQNIDDLQRVYEDLATHWGYVDDEPATTLAPNGVPPWLRA